MAKRTPKEEKKNEDATRPDQDAAANMAAMDQFEAEKKGEANPPPSKAAAPKAAKVSGDWAKAEADISAAMAGVQNAKCEIEAGLIKVTAPSQAEAKDAAAVVWRKLGHLRSSKTITSLPTVVTEVGAV